MPLEEQVARDLVRLAQGDLDAAKRIAESVGPEAAMALLPGWARTALKAGRAAYDELAQGGIVPDIAIMRGGQDWPYATPGYERFIAKLDSIKAGVLPLVGRIGAGKSTTLCAIANRWDAPHTYMVGYPEEALVGTPLLPIPWDMRQIARVPEGSVIIMPDASLFLDSRQSADAAHIVFYRLLILARHESKRYLLDLQSSRALDLRAFGECWAVGYKELGELWPTLERGPFLPMAIESQQALLAIPERDRIKYLWASCQSIGFKGLVPVTVPDWYGPTISTARGHFDVFYDQPKQRRYAAPAEEIEDAEWEER